jgi:hypothetical protein
VQPARPHAGLVAFNAIDWKPCRPLPDHERKINTGMYRIVDRSGKPRINLHQQRAIVCIASEFYFAHALHTDGRSQTDGRSVDILWDWYALPHH